MREDGWKYWSFWNLIDLTYTGLNFLLIYLYFLDDSTSLDTQRTLAAISFCAIWFRVIEWLRLFESTAFFIRLIEETMDYIKYFMIIMILWYIMFYTAIDILNLGTKEIEPDDESMIRLSGVLSLDAFISQYQI